MSEERFKQLRSGSIRERLAFVAKDQAYPDSADPAFAEAIWWLPDPHPDPNGSDDF